MADVEKKRKRNSEGAPKPKKRRSLGSAPSNGPKIKVTHIPRDDENGPVIASTPGTTLPPPTTFTAYYKKLPKSSGSSQPAHTAELLLHSSTHPRLDYTARENQDANAAEGALRHYIGVYDPETHELQVVEARKVAIRPSLRAEEERVREEQRVKQASRGALSLRQELGLTFGTKKARKAISSLAENAIVPSNHSPSTGKTDPTSAASLVLSSISQSAALAPSKEDIKADSDASKPRPVPNLAAESVSDVYRIGGRDGIVGDGVLRDVKVKPWVEAVEAGTPVQTPSRFVSRRIEDIVESEDIQKLKVLKYLLLLIKFSQVLRPGGKKGKHGRKVPQREVLLEKMDAEEGLVEGIRRKFAEGGEMSKWHVDNLRTHCCALSLIIDDFESDTHDLREDLGLNPKEISSYFSEIGAKVSPMTQAEQTREKLGSRAEALLHPIARLSLPLQFPRERRGAPQGRRR